MSALRRLLRLSRICAPLVVSLATVAQAGQIWTDGDGDGLPDEGNLPGFIQVSDLVSVDVWLDSQSFVWTYFQAWVEHNWTKRFYNGYYLVDGGTTNPIDTFGNPSATGLSGNGFAPHHGVTLIGRLTYHNEAPWKNSVRPIIDYSNPWGTFSIIGNGSSYMLFTTNPGTAWNKTEYPVDSLGLMLNEVYVDHVGTDSLEFVELCGEPGSYLTNTWLLVLDGDASEDPGTVDMAVDIDDFFPAVPADGRLVIGDDAVPGVDIPIGAGDQFENGTQTVLLVLRFDPITIGADLDADDDGIPDVSAGSFIDAVCLTDGGASDLCYYAVAIAGPDGGALPAGVQRCPDCSASLNTLMSYVLNGSDGRAPISPDAANSCGATATEAKTWGQIKALFQ